MPEARPDAEASPEPEPPVLAGGRYPEDGAERRATRRVSLALALLVFAVVAPFVAEANAQAGVRFAFAGAVVDDGTIRLDGYEGFLAADDFVERDGHLYADKAPGQLVLSLPFYAAGRALGFEPATTFQYEGNLSLWWITFWSATVPAAALSVLMYRAARRWYAADALAAAVALTFGTMLVLFAGNLYAHTLSALLGFAAWMLVDRNPRDPRLLLASGAICGIAVATEYTMAIVVVAIAISALARGTGRRILWFVLGGLPVVPLLAWYHHVSYGSALRTSYSSKDSLGGSTIIDLPDPGTGFQVLVGTRGILLLTPIVFIALVGAVHLVRGSGPTRRHGWLLLGLLAAFTVFQAGWPNPWGGEMPGPRYLLPVLPFGAVPLAAVWARHARACWAATAIGGAIMGAGLMTFHLVAQNGGVIRTYLDRLLGDGRAPTLLALALGPAGWVVHVVLVGAAIVFLVRSSRVEASLRPATTAD